MDTEQQAAIQKLKMMRKSRRVILGEVSYQESHTQESNHDYDIEFIASDDHISESETESMKEWRRKKREQEALADQNSIHSFIFGESDETYETLPAASPLEIVMDAEQQATIQRLDILQKSSGVISGEVSHLESHTQESNHDYDIESIASDDHISESETESMKQWRRKKREQ